LKSSHLGAELIDLGAALIWGQQRLGFSSDLGAAAIWQQQGFGGSRDVTAAAKVILFYFRRRDPHIISASKSI